MRQNDILKSIDEKLTPGSSVQEELFRRAAELRAGEKYIGSAEEVFLEKGIEPETIKWEQPFAARVKSRKLAIAATAAAVALLVGAAALFGTMQHTAVEKDSSNAAQKQGESETDTTPQIHIAEDYPAQSKDLLYQLLVKCYDEYTEAGSDYTKLTELESFKVLTSYFGRKMTPILYDMYQNGEVEERYVFIAENARAYAQCTDKGELAWCDGEYEDDVSYEFFESVNKEYDIIHSMSLYIDDEEDDPERKDIKRLLDSLKDESDYKKSNDYQRLIKVGEYYGDFYQKVAAMYIAGDLDEKQLEIAYQAAKYMLSEEKDYSGVLQPESEIAPDASEYYAKEMTETPKDRLLTENDVGAWVDMKLTRIADRLGTANYDMQQDVNFKSLKALGVYTLQKAILGDWYFFNDDSKKDKAAVLVLKELGWGVEDCKTLDEARAAAMKNCCSPDIFKGVYDGKYREAGYYYNNRDAFDGLFAAFKEFDAVSSTADKMLLTDEQAADARKTAFAYADLFQCVSGSTGFVDTSSSQKLSVIIPNKQENTLIIGQTKYTNVDKQAFEDIRLALYDMIKPYGTEAVNREYQSVDAELTYSSSRKTEKKTFYDRSLCDMVFEVACYVSENKLGCAVEPDEIPNNSTGHEMTLELKNEKGEIVCTVYTPLKDGDELYINGVKYTRCYNQSILLYSCINELDKSTQA